MSIRNLDKILAPRRVAVIGVDDCPQNLGRLVLENLVAAGFPGAVYAIGAARQAVAGVMVYPELSQVSHLPDLALICTAAEDVPAVVRACGENGTLGLVILSGGFREVGVEGRRLEERILREQRRFDGMRILGPNCLGVIVPQLHLNASAAAEMPKAGHVALISQSAALCTSVLDWAVDEGVGFSHFVSVGNLLDVGMGDLIDYFGSATETAAIILYLEAISEAREFLSAARAFARSKPIVAYKAGRFAESAEAAASHTGALAGVDAVYEAVFQRAGIERIFYIEEMFDCAELLARQVTPKGDRLAIVTNAGGPGVMTTDALLASQGHLAAFSAETMTELASFLPPGWSRGNPLDLLGDATPARYARALKSVLADRQVDAVLAILAPQTWTDPAATARAVAEVAAHAHKPLLAAWMGGHLVHEGIQVLNAAGIPTYNTPDKAVRAFMHLVSYARNLEILHETPLAAPLEFAPDRQRMRSVLPELARAGRAVLGEDLSKTFLDAYGIPSTRPQLARTAAEAVQAACALGYPVVLKIHSPQISHKTEVDGVVLNLSDDAAVLRAYENMLERVRRLRPEVEILGATVQKMLASPCSFELIVGARKDPVFGPVILVGMGGVAAEVFEDRALGLPPLNDVLARRMLASLKSWPLLCGYRGRPAAALDRLIEVILRVSYLVADYPEIKELDINPLLVTPTDVVALDARVVLDLEAIGRPLRPFGHLAICPYPEEYVGTAQLGDGTPLVLRPIKPEDEPRWHELLAHCSRQSLWLRFRYLFKQSTHEMATRYCFIDYDREIGMVAEVTEEGQRKLVGVGCLVADVDHTTAEYAVLVADRWQGRGLGGALTDHCLDVARRWGVRRVVAEVAQENAPMLGVFRHRGFVVDDQRDHDVFLLSKLL